MLKRDCNPSQYPNTVKSVLSPHSWGMSKVISQERWPLKRGSVKTDQSCHQMDCQALSRNIIHVFMDVNEHKLCWIMYMVYAFYFMYSMHKCNKFSNSVCQIKI
jgi:hypothetical protein